jgi:hypothetical protein
LCRARVLTSALSAETLLIADVAASTAFDACECALHANASEPAATSTAQRKTRRI